MDMRSLESFSMSSLMDLSFMTYSTDLKIFFRSGKPVPFMALTDDERRFVLQKEANKERDLIPTDCPF